MGHPAEVKLYLEASTKDELIQAMVDNNRFHQMYFAYDSPIKEGSKWVVWFTANIQEYYMNEANRKPPVVIEKPKKVTKKKSK